MYIESADLSEKHAEVKYDKGWYILNDMDSDGGNLNY